MRISRRRVEIGSLLVFYIYNHGTYCPIYASPDSCQRWCEFIRGCTYGHIDANARIKQTQEKLKRCNRNV